MFIPNGWYFVCGKQKQKLELNFSIVYYFVLRYYVFSYSMLRVSKPLFPLTASRLSRELINSVKYAVKLR